LELDWIGPALLSIYNYGAEHVWIYQCHD